MAEFLHSRRARLDPGQVGVATYGSRPRRVAGLRREELAALAGVSVDYYVRLEQGRAGNISQSVLDAVARALRLDDDERAHLSRLARPPRVVVRRRPPQRVRPELRHLLDAMSDTAAYLVGQRTDVLAWNALGAALITGLETLPARRRNFARIMFSDDVGRSLFVDWPAKARDLVAFLRLDAGRRPNDPALAELVGELSIASDLFRRLWADNPVANKGHAAVALQHPVAGRLDLFHETLAVAGDPEQMVVTYSAAPDSTSRAALVALASWHATAIGQAGLQQETSVGPQRSTEPHQSDAQGPPSIPHQPTKGGTAISPRAMGTTDPVTVERTA